MDRFRAIPFLEEVRDIAHAKGFNLKQPDIAGVGGRELYSMSGTWVNLAASPRKKVDLQRTYTRCCNMASNWLE
jgi:hypothetical protein